MFLRWTDTASGMTTPMLIFRPCFTQGIGISTISAPFASIKVNGRANCRYYLRVDVVLVKKVVGRNSDAKVFRTPVEAERVVDNRLVSRRRVAWIVTGKRVHHVCAVRNAARHRTYVVTAPA